ncbi:MAG: sulfatase-like hydrolase/transferase [Nitriliruptorales bacterium]
MIRRVPIHPVAFAAAPIVFLWGQNVGEVVPQQVAGPVWLSITTGLALFGLLTAALRSVRRGALLASGLAFLYFSYGHVRAGTGASTNTLLFVWGLLTVVLVVLAVRLGDSLGEATKAANVAGIALLAVAALPLATLIGSDAAAAEPGETGTLPPLPAAEERPDRDIWYIVPDRYGSERNLREHYGFDNSDFIAYLESKGFTVVDDALTNYPKTAHALAASLNMSYLDHLADNRGDDWGPVYAMFREHRLGEFLTRHGYRYTHIGSWWTPTSTSDHADVTLRFGQLSEFASVLRGTTILPDLRRTLTPEEEEFEDTPDEFRLRQRDHTAFGLDAMERLAARRDSRPDFVLAHLTLPHGPNVFRADGTYVTGAEDRLRTKEEGYLEQVQYANRRFREILDLLLDRPQDEMPIVVLQADEGVNPPRLEADIPGFVWPKATTAELEQKFEVISALLLPGVDAAIPEGMTSVNTFRFLLDTYFGTDLGLLPDRAFVFHNERDMYHFTDVTDRLRPAR